MSNCCVKGCKTRKRAGDTVSFHRFPNSEPYYSLWLQACGRGDWRPPSIHSRICSIHFEEHLLIRSESVTFLVPGAVPTKFIHVSLHVNEEKTEGSVLPEKTANPITTCNELIYVCRICLKTDRSMSMLENNLLYIYQSITNIQIASKDKLPRMLCWECKHRLITCDQFTKLAKNSNRLLTELLNGESNVSLEKMKSLDTEDNHISNLVQKIYPPDHSDLNIIENNETDIEKNTQMHTEHINLVNDIKSEIILDDKIYNEEMEYFQDIRSDKSDISDTEATKYIFAERLKTNKEEETIYTRVRRKKHKSPEELDPEVFVTTNLTPEEQMREVELRKERDNYKFSPYKCEECYKGFLNEGIYRSHMARHSDQCGSYICEVCKVHYHSMRALRHHVTSHMQRFNCKRCPFVTTRRHAAKLHNEYHNGTRYNCPNCEEDFGKLSTYLSHLRIKHPSDIVCPLCGCSFVSGKGLLLHQKLKHRFEQHTITNSSPLCVECKIHFASEEALQQHYKVSARHKDRQTSLRKGRPIKKCNSENEHNKSLKKMEKARSNKLNHKVKGPIPCEQCDKQLPNSLSYYWHFRNSHPDKNRTKYPSMPYRCMCEVCGKMFQSLALLHDHSSSHTNVKQFQCALCEKTFSRRYRLVAHARVHAERARHACPACGKMFSTRSNMRRHSASHSGARPYKCEMCGKAFKHVSLLRVHISYVHMKKPWPKRSRGKTSERQSTNSQVTAVGRTDNDVAQPMWEG